MGDYEERTVIPRHETHGHEMIMGSQQNDRTSEPTSGSNASMMAIHCHDCWKYTDDSRAKADLTHEAMLIFTNATPSSEQTDVYRSACDYLVKAFVPRVPDMPKWGH